jgi:ribose transport system substrate-binding protein
MRLGIRLVAGLLLAAFVLTGGCGPGSGGGSAGGGAGKKRIILLTNGNSPFWDACRAGLQAGDKDFGLSDAGLVAVMEVNDGTPKGQIDKLRQYGNQADVVGIAVSALDADNIAVAEEMKKLRDKGIKVICVDADVNRDRFKDSRAYYIGTDNLTGGKALGTAAKGLLDSRSVMQGSYVQFVGRTGSDNARKRMDGFNQAVGEGFEEADRMGDDLKRDKSRENVRNAITNHPDLVALVGIWSYNAPAIVDVVEEKGVQGKYVVVGFDAEPLAVEYMAQGKIDAMVVQDPYDMGYKAVQLLKAMIEGDEKTVKELFPGEGDDADMHITGLKVVVPDEKSPLKAEMFDASTQFMTLAEFKSWLDKYGLKGS